MSQNDFSLQRQEWQQMIGTLTGLLLLAALFSSCNKFELSLPNNNILLPAKLSDF